MKNSKLASLLSKLSQKEFKEFGKFVKSSYFNTNSNIIKLYDLIAKSFPDFDSPKLAKENIYKHVYTGEKYNDSTARGLLAAALKLAEEFLAVTRLREKEFAYKEFLMAELADRKIHDLFNIHLKKNRAELESMPSKDEDYFFLSYKMETMINAIDSKAFIPLTQKDIPGDMNTKDSENLINYFLLSILKRYNYLLTKSGSLNVKVELSFMDEIIDYLEKTNLREIPILNFHYNRAMLYRSNMEEKYFLELRRIFFDKNNGLDESERYNLMGSLSNFCVRKNNIKGEEVPVAQYEIYKYSIENDILSLNPTEPINPVLFSNIVAASIYLGKTDEAVEFIQKFEDRLAPERKDSAVNINMAKVHFKNKNYNDALSSLALVQNEDVFYKIAIKNLYAMIYYELNLVEELILLLDSYKSFLQSNVVIGPRLKENHINFVSALTKLLKLKDFKDKHELEYLKHEINSLPNTVSIDWLIGKIDNLLR
ncbi:MAG: hypothetical protein KBG21_00955 [Ignavibacteria bacterium]|nr:hypothetical protein [Ignavibacteria bacterium]